MKHTHQILQTFWKTKARTIQFCVLGVAMIVATLLGSCKKDLSSAPAATNTEAASNLERRIQEFYGRMKSIHQSKAANKNAKITEDVYISVDSAEFLIESTYNYYCASTADDSSDVQYFEFSFNGAIANDSILSESEASAFMQQIKDSIMVQYDEISYQDKALTLFDLEIQHSGGNNEATFEVAYSITKGSFPRPVQSSLPGGSNDVWAVLPVTECGVFWPYIGPGFDAYRNGVAVTNFSNSTITPFSASCHTGAGAELRRYGINNFKASYSYPNPAKLVTGITRQLAFSLSSIGTVYPYKTAYGNGGPTVVGFLNFDQYKVTADDAGGNIPSTAGGANFYAHWLNTPMMNFYLGYIPGKIEQHRLGRTFYDFQIRLGRHATTGPTSNPLLNIEHDYLYFYGSETLINKYWPQISIVDLLTEY